MNARLAILEFLNENYVSRTTSSASCILSLVSVARSVLLPRAYNVDLIPIDLVPDTGYPCTLFRIDGVKQCHVKFQRQTSHKICQYEVEFVHALEVSTSFKSLLTVRISTVAIASKKVAMIASTHRR